MQERFHDKPQRTPRKTKGFLRDLCGSAREEYSSELQFQSQLRRAWAADLIQRIEAAILAAASERGSQHPRRLTEERGTEVVWGGPKLGWLKMLKNPLAPEEQAAPGF